MREQKKYESSRTRARKRHLYKGASEAPMSTDDTDGNIHAWRDRLSSLFSKNPFGSARSREASRGQGWVQAASVDDWDVEIGHNDLNYDHSYDRPSILQTPSRSFASHSYSGMDTPVSRSNTASTAHSVRFELPAIHPMSNSDLRALQAPNILSQFASPPTSRSASPMQVRTLSPEPISPLTPDHPSLENEAVRFKAPSPMPRQSSSSSGTKFIEILE